jgi:hypothetical protein
VALLFVDGCSHYASDDVGMKWQAATSASIVDTYPRRPGGKSIMPYENFGIVSPYFGPSNFVACGAAVKSSGFTMSFSINGNFQIQLRLVSTQLRVYAGNYVNLLAFVELAGILTPGEWYYYELAALVHATQGTVQVRFNGIVLPELTLTGVCTKGYSYQDGVNQVQFGGSGSRFTDVYIDDERSHGDCIVETLYPTGAGNHSDWTPSAGANYENVDDPGDIDGDGTFNSTLVQGAKDSFIASNVAPRPASIIKGVALHVTARKDESAGRVVKPMLRVGGTDYDHEADGLILSDLYHGAQRIWGTNPNTGLTWTESGINGSEIGYDLVTAL